MNESTMQSCHPKCISWSAIIIGALVGIGLSFLLNLFSIAIGLSAFSTTEGVMAIAMGGYIGLLIGVIVAMFMSGFTAGFLGKPYAGGRCLGILYGFTAWCLALLLMAVFASRIGNYVAAYTSFAASPAVIVTVDENTSRNTMTMDSKSSSSSMSAEETAKTVGTGAFAIFALFFIGALSSCFGGHSGFACREKCDQKKCGMRE